MSFDIKLYFCIVIFIFKWRSVWRDSRIFLLFSLVRRLSSIKRKAVPLCFISNSCIFHLFKFVVDLLFESGWVVSLSHQETSVPKRDNLVAIDFRCKTNYAGLIGPGRKTTFWSFPRTNYFWREFCISPKSFPSIANCLLFFCLHYSNYSISIVLLLWASLPAYNLLADRFSS